MSELTVGAGLARGLIEFAVSRGAGRAELAEQAGIDLEDLEDQDNRVPFTHYVALMRAARVMTGDPALALHYGAFVDLSRVSVVGLIGNASTTMLEAFAQLNRYGRLVIEFDGGPDRFRLRHDATGLWLIDDRQNPNAFPELTESTFARMVCGPRQWGMPPFVREMRVTHPAPAHRDEYDRLLQIPVTFEADENALLMDPIWLTHRVQLEPRYVFGILSEHAETLLRNLEASRTTRGKVERLLMPVLHTGEATMDAVAGQMGVGRQTLFRRLKAEGTTYEKVLDDLRHRLAVHYLAGHKVSVNETAYLVGFSEPAAFSRAFKRWTGKNPREMRGQGLGARG